MSKLGDWRDALGAPISCAGKRQAMDANLAELVQQYRDALDDALLLGCSEASFRSALQDAFAKTLPTVKERISKE